ncbi:hypothetical protein F5Y10DRAFT_218466 [Nemania abortiva]|nr:hypothetical protein F5Y10DRAFT_218466 [Nemania abortiva]
MATRSLLHLAYASTSTSSMSAGNSANTGTGGASYPLTIGFLSACLPAVPTDTREARAHSRKPAANTSAGSFRSWLPASLIFWRLGSVCLCLSLPCGFLPPPPSPPPLCGLAPCAIPFYCAATGNENSFQLRGRCASRLQPRAQDPGKKDWADLASTTTGTRSRCRSPSAPHDDYNAKVRVGCRHGVSACLYLHIIHHTCRFVRY